MVSLREAAEYPDAYALCWVVHADDIPVGFAMIADEVGSPGSYGFEQTGETWSDDEVLLRLELGS